MLSFQSPRKLVNIFIAILITQIVFTQATQSTTSNSTTTTQCIGGFSINANKQKAICLDKDYQAWHCPMAKCGKDGHLWVLMTNCLHNGVVGSGASKQNCAQYNNQPNSYYGCKNPGGETYVCLYNPSEGMPPYITCSECVKEKDQTAPGTGTK